MYALTGKQQTVLAFIRQYFLEHRRSPLIREIQLACQIASYKSVLDRLNALEHKGYIKRLPNKHRGIRVVRRANAPAENRPASVPAGNPGSLDSSTVAESR